LIKTKEERIGSGHSSVHRIPLLVRRGGREAAGVVGHESTCGVSDHPVCGIKVGFAEIF